jgi:hypothetical protein
MTDKNNKIALSLEEAKDILYFLSKLRNYMECRYDHNYDKEIKDLEDIIKELVNKITIVSKSTY